MDESKRRKEVIGEDRPEIGDPESQRKLCILYHTLQDLFIQTIFIEILRQAGSIEGLKLTSSYNLTKIKTNS